MRMNPTGEWISVPEAARLKGVAESSVRMAIRTGRLNGAKVGRSYIVRRGDVDGWRPGPRGPKRGRLEKQVMPSHPTREEILAFLEADPQEQEKLLRENAQPGMESAYHRAARLKAAVSEFAHRAVSTEEYFREKRSEIELEQRRADARDP
jgi:excisionase family DNA binding protein